MELEKARLIASLLRESETDHAAAVPQTRSELDSGQVQTDILCSQKVKVAHHTPHQFSDNAQHSTPNLHQSNPVSHPCLLIDKPIV